MSDFSNTTWHPIIDLNKTGTRTFDATANTYPVTWSSTAVGASDTLTSQTFATWSPGNYRVVTSGAAAAAVFSVEVITDQGFDIGVTGGGFAGSAMLAGPVAVNGDGTLREAYVLGNMVNL